MVGKDLKKKKEKAAIDLRRRRGDEGRLKFTNSLSGRHARKKN